MGTGTTVSGSVVWSVTTVPATTVVEPVTPASVAVHVLERLVAVRASFPEVLRVLRVAELVTDPDAGVPWVLTSILFQRGDGRREDGGATTGRGWCLNHVHPPDVLRANRRGQAPFVPAP